jgi:hypothetical protein
MAYENWLVSTATIEGSEWEDAPPSPTPSSLFVGRFTVAFSYAVSENRYLGKFDSSHAWAKDTEVGLLRNPERPEECCVCDEDEPRIIEVFECALDLFNGL